MLDVARFMWENGPPRSGPTRLENHENHDNRRDSQRRQRRNCLIHEQLYQRRRGNHGCLIQNQAVRSIASAARDHLRLLGRQVLFLTGLRGAPGGSWPRETAWRAGGRLLPGSAVAPRLPDHQSRQDFRVLPRPADGPQRIGQPRVTASSAQAGTPISDSRLRIAARKVRRRPAGCLLCVAASEFPARAGVSG
jgi:hypothetical protein